MNLARAIYSWMPWNVRRTISSARQYWRQRRPPFEGVYSTFGDVPLDEAAAQGFALEAVRGVQHSVDFSAPRLLLPTVVAMLGLQRTPVRILDFGGGAGIDFKNLLQALGQNLSVEYLVVDLPEVCEQAQLLWAQESRIKFVDRLPTSEAKFDLVYAFSSIQYISNLPALFDAFASYDARAILLARSLFHETAFVRRQVNLGIRTPHWVANLHDAESQLAKSGYRLSLTAFVDEDWNVDNYDPAHKITKSANLLFLKNQPI